MVANGPRKTHPTSRRVRVIHNHTYVVDTTKALHVWEHDNYPQLYFPLSELKVEWKDKETVKRDGDVAAAVVEIVIPAREGIKEVKSDRVLRFADDPRLGILAGLVRLEFGSMGRFTFETVPRIDGEEKSEANS